MRTILLSAILVASGVASAACPTTSRDNYGTGQILTSSALNADFNQLVTKLNALSGDCLTNETVSREKLADGSLAAPGISSKSADYSATSSDDAILVNSSGASRTVTLPAAGTVSGKIFYIKKTDTSTNSVILATTGGETIDGATSKTMYGEQASTVVVSDGSSYSSMVMPFMPVAILKDRKSANVAGGTFTGGDPRVRDLNHIDDPFGFVTGFSSNTFTLPAGTYLFEATCPAAIVSTHKCKLVNTTASSDAIVGTGAYADTGGAVQNQSVIVGYVTIAASTTFNIQHQSDVTRATNGFGYAGGDGIAETYTVVKITKVR